MGIPVPKTLGALTLVFAGAGCSDAQVLANAFEAVCKAECECPPEDGYEGYYSEELSEKNCKKVCEGYALIQEAYLDDQFEDEKPCDDLKKYAKELKACKKESCGDARDECVGDAYSKISECLGGSGGYYYYDNSTPADPEAFERRQIIQALGRELLYGATTDCDNEADTRSRHEELICSIDKVAFLGEDFEGSE